MVDPQPWAVSVDPVSGESRIDFDRSTLERGDETAPTGWWISRKANLKPYRSGRPLAIGFFAVSALLLLFSLPSAGGSAWAVLVFGIMLAIGGTIFAVGPGTALRDEWHRVAESQIRIEPAGHTLAEVAAVVDLAVRMTFPEIKSAVPPRYAEGYWRQQQNKVQLWLSASNGEKRYLLVVCATRAPPVVTALKGAIARALFRGDDGVSPASAAAMAKRGREVSREPDPAEPLSVYLGHLMEVGLLCTVSLGILWITVFLLWGEVHSMAPPIDNRLGYAILALGTFGAFGVLFGLLALQTMRFDRGRWRCWPAPASRAGHVESKPH